VSQRAKIDFLRMREGNCTSLRFRKDKKLIREVPDWPKKGILFYDITTLLKDKVGFATLIDRFSEHYLNYKIDLVLGMEARGFIFAPALAPFMLYACRAPEHWFGRMLSSRPLRFAGLGVLLGVVAFYAAAPEFRSVLYEVPPADPTTLGAAAAGVLIGGRTAIAFSGCKDFPIQDAHGPDY